MKKIKLLMIVFSLFFSVLLPFHAQAEEAALNWSMDIDKVTHTFVRFTLKGMEKVETAYLHVNDGESEETHPIEIKNETQNFEIAFDKIYHASSELSFFITDSQGNSTGMTTDTVSFCQRPDEYLRLYCTAYPKKFEGVLRLYSDMDFWMTNFTAEATVGFETYTADVQSDGSFYITYPEQELDVPVTVTVKDGYGCEDTATFQVENSSVQTPYFKKIGPVMAISETDFSPKGCYDEIQIGDQIYTAQIINPDSHDSYMITTYPKQAVGTVIQAWKKHPNGSKSAVGSYTVENCDFGINDNRISTYPAMIKGAIDYDFNYGSKCDATVEVAGKTYTAPVSKNGLFSISYPKSAVGSAVKLTFSDNHGCISDTRIFKTSSEDYFKSINANSITVYPKLTEGNINHYSDLKRFASIEISGKTYTATVGSSGIYSISYPSAPPGSTVKLIFSDEHGCSVSFSKKVSTQQCDTPEIPSTRVLPTKITAEDPPSDVRLAVQIGSKIYYSKYNSYYRSRISVTYPVARPGTAVTAWFEEENGVTSEKVSRKIFRQTSSYKKTNYTSTYFKAEIAWNKKYYDSHMTSAKATIGKKTYKGKIKGNTIKFSFPKQKRGTKIKVTLVDNYKFSSTKTFTLRNKPIKLSIKPVYYYSSMLSGTTAPKSRVTVKVGKKTYKLKASRKGKFSFKLKPQKPGTNIKVKSIDPYKFYNTKKMEVKAEASTTKINQVVYKDNSTVSVTCGPVNKGDRLTLSVNGNTYQRQFTSRNASRQVITFSVSGLTAGSTVYATLYDRFNKVRSSDSAMVYYGDRISVGMSASNVLLTTWGRPISTSSNGTVQVWVYRSNSTYYYVYITNGVVSKILQAQY